MRYVRNNEELKRVYLFKLDMLERLEDYLQEIFDKYSIKKVNTIMDTSKGKNYFIDIDSESIAIHFDLNESVEYLKILHNDVSNSIKNIESNIKKRLNRRIIINTNSQSFSWITIQIENICNT